MTYEKEVKKGRISALFYKFYLLLSIDDGKSKRVIIRRCATQAS
jgi:hypothetical protein